jgi:hypothetical protein
MELDAGLEANNGLLYVIFDVTELPNIDFNEVLQTSAETCRLSVDKTQTLVKWFGDQPIPACVENLTTKSPYYTHDEILVIMATPEWTEPMSTPVEE